MWSHRKNIRSRLGGSPIIVGAAVLVLSAVGAWQVVTEERSSASSSLTLASLPDVVMDAHRSGAGEPGMRENSVTAAERILASGRVDVLDIDTRLRGDKVLVLMHDATVDRTTDSTGPVASYTAATWRHVHLDTGPGAPEPVPTLADYLDAVGGRAVVTVELKDPGGLPVITDMLRKRHLTQSVMVNTNDPQVARRIHERGLLTHLWRSAGQMRDDDPREWRSFVDVLDVDHRASDEQLRAAVHSGIRRVWAHTLTTGAQRERMLRLGVGGIITDYPLTLDSR